MHRCPFHSKFVEKILSKVMAPPNFPVKYADVKAKLHYEDACPADFHIGSVKVIPIPLSHPNGGSGYKFIENNKTFVFLTDNELGSVHPGGRPYNDYVEFSANADLLIHDAEYTPQEYKTYFDWGHSVYSEVVKLGLEAGVKKLGLFHLNQDRTDAEMDDMVKACRRIIGRKHQRLDCFAVGCDTRFDLS
jgi:phosphoribosyl 1,2-cyclic phosphodiesterase